MRVFGRAREITLRIATTTRARHGQTGAHCGHIPGTHKMTGTCELARIDAASFRGLFPEGAASGPSIPFRAELSGADPATGNGFSMTLHHCVAERLAFGSGAPEFALAGLAFQRFADAAGRVSQIEMGGASSEWRGPPGF